MTTEEIKTFEMKYKDDGEITKLFKKACDIGILNELQFPENLDIIPIDVKYEILHDILKDYGIKIK